jgi:hypothetical protein
MLLTHSRLDSYMCTSSASKSNLRTTILHCITTTNPTYSTVLLQNCARYLLVWWMLLYGTGQLPYYCASPTVTAHNTNTGQRENHFFAIEIGCYILYQIVPYNSTLMQRIADARPANGNGDLEKPGGRSTSIHSLRCHSLLRSRTYAHVHGARKELSPVL